MGNLDLLQQVAADAAGQQLYFVRGTVLAAPSGSTGYQVSVNGNVVPVSASDSAPAAVGDSVLVAFVGTGRGQAEAIVLCRMSPTGLHPATGTVTVVPVSSATITVVGADGVTYTAYFLSSYTPTVGDNVEMVFLAGVPYVTKTGATPAPGPALPVGSSAVTTQTGTTPFAASDSATYWSGGGWGSYGDTRYIYSGTYGGNTVNGAFFYGNGPTQLQGRTINGGRVVFGKRGGAGNFNAPATVNVYTHGSASRPGGNVTTLNGPATVVAQPWQDGLTVALSVAQATDVVNGGGLVIVGGDYADFQGVQLNAQSGTVSIDWSR